jgi:hypothetical protein
MAAVVDERVRLVQKVGGGREIRVLASDLDAMGRDAFYGVLDGMGFGPADLGEPRALRSHPAEFRIIVKERS